KPSLFPTLSVSELVALKSRRSGKSVRTPGSKLRASLKNLVMSGTWERSRGPASRFRRSLAGGARPGAGRASGRQPLQLLDQRGAAHAEQACRLRDDPAGFLHRLPDQVLLHLLQVGLEVERQPRARARGREPR